MKPDLRVQWQLFASVAAFIALIGTVYWFVSYENAGTTMLALASGLALLLAGWLYLQQRGSSDGSASDAPVEEDYLPTASVWPLAIGVAAALTVNGLILGWAYAAPGAAALALAVAGFVAQSRRRT